MYTKKALVFRLDLILLISCSLYTSMAQIEAHSAIYGYSNPSVNLFSHVNKLDNNKLTSNDDTEAERTFQQFINSHPESTVIGELKPNSSELDMMLMREKIASSIMNIQELERAQNAQSSRLSENDCFIAVTRVDRVTGKCHKVNNGLPVCQSGNYLAINTEECS